jgi:hypothetical protein
MNLIQTVTAALERLRSAGPVEVREEGKWIAALDQFQYDVREQGDVVLLHLWSGECNLVRRVLRICDEGPEQLSVEVGRFGRVRPGRLEFATETGRAPSRVVHEKFRSRFRDLLAHHFPDEKIASLTTAADLQHSLSGNYARGILESGSSSWAVLGAAPGESTATYDGLLTCGILWLDRARQSSRRRTIAGLRLFFPAGQGRVTSHRLQALSASTIVELYEYAEDTWRVRRVDDRDIGNVETWLVPRRDVDAVLAQAATAIEHVRNLAPHAIDPEVLAGTCEVVLRYRGLAFARWQDGATFYGIGDPREPLTAESEPKLRRLLRDLETYRSPVPQTTKHPLFRAQPERWLETLVAADPTRVDARLDQRFVYTQVPAFSAGDRGVMDLLGVLRDGRLAVIELKASEDLQLVFQGVDYWLRVRWHHAQQDFTRYGYFPGVTLDPRPPLLFLVGPSLRFHPAGDVLLRYLSSDVEIHRVGVSETWRRGLKVVLRQTRD